ncbi:hypothetical protein pb186bvf_021134 [Paramecium bursaria]
MFGLHLLEQQQGSNRHHTLEIIILIKFLYRMIFHRAIHIRIARGRKAVKKTTVKLEKKQQEIRKIQGQIEIGYQVIQYSQKQFSEPKISISNVRGSPKAGDRTLKMDTNGKKIHLVKIRLISSINITKTMTNKYHWRKLNQGLEYKHQQQRHLAISFSYKKDRVHKFEQTLNILAKEKQQSQIEKIKIRIKKERVTKEEIYNTLQSMGASVSEIFVIQNNDFDNNLIHELLDGLNIGLFLDIIPSMVYEQQDDVLEIVSEQLFETIKDYLRQKKRLLQPLVNFIKAIINRPEFGVIVAQFADQYQNSGPKRKIIKDKGEVEFVSVPIVFLEHFDINRNHPYKMDNYEHIVLLTKIRKLIRLYLNKDSLLFQDIEQAYIAAKTSLYFVLLKLPKNLKDKFDEKKDLIILGEWSLQRKVNYKEFKIAQRVEESKSFVTNQFFKIQEEINQKSLFPPPCLFNIFHESVRRKRWNNLSRGFIAAPDYYYQQDSSERTPLSALLEQGPFDIIRQFLQDFSINQRGISDFEETRPSMDIIRFIKSTTTRQNKNCLHLLSMNKIPNPQSQLKCLQILIRLLPEEQIQLLQNQAILGINTTPVCAFLIAQSTIQNRLFGQDTETIQDIITLLSNKVELDLTQFRQFLQDTQDITQNQDFEHMAYIIGINGLYDKLSLIINKIQDTELMLYLVGQGLIQQNKYLGIYNTKMAKGAKIQQFANIKEKYGDLMKIQQHLIFMLEPRKQRSSQIYRKNPKQFTIPLKFKYFISQWGSNRDKKTYKDIYLQKLRQTFLNQKIDTLFQRQIQNDAQNFEQTFTLIINYLTTDKINQIQEQNLKYIQEVTKKFYLLPLYHDNCNLMFLTFLPKVSIIKAIDLIVQYQLMKNPNYNIRNDQKQRLQRCINFIKKYFTSDLVELLNNIKDKIRIFGIIRTLYITLDKSQDDHKIQFALQVLLVLVQKWKQEDFQHIIEDSKNLFKSFAVVMVRAQTRNPDAIAFIRQQLDGKSFFQLKFGYTQGDRLKLNENLSMHPDRILIEMTEKLITVNLKNQEYLTFLYKSSIKPFLKNYKGKFSNKIGQNLNILEYLVYNMKISQNVIISNKIEYLVDDFKRISIKDQNDKLRWIYIGITTGSVQTLLFVTQNILRLDEKSFFANYIKSDLEILQMLVSNISE